MKSETKVALLDAWSYCDQEDKSTEFMFAYMGDMAAVDLDTVLDFVFAISFKERQAYHKTGKLPKY